MRECSRTMHARAAELIETLGLEPHPEGGYYRELFRSPVTVTPADQRGERAAITTICFLLTRGGHSRWHKVRSDEVWHLYEGGPLELLEADLATATLTRHCLGRIGDGTNSPVRTIPGGHWQAARSIGEYTLVGCTVGPGFEYDDFVMLADEIRDARFLTERWPDVASLL